MPASLALFGKHPAWSDHMVLVDPGDASGSLLKRLFYDHSVVPASRAEIDPTVFADIRFIVGLEDGLALVVGLPSRDSVGRSRFPLFAAHPLPDAPLEALSPEYLDDLADSLLGFLESVIPEPGAPAPSCDEVEAARTRFSPPDAPASVSPHRVRADLFRPMVRGLADGHTSFTFRADALPERLALAGAVCRQFKTPPRFLLLLNRPSDPSAIFIKGAAETGFQLESFFTGRLPALDSFRTGGGGAAAKVLGTLEEGRVTLAVGVCPSLRLASVSRRAPLARLRALDRRILVAAGVAVFLLLLILVFALRPARPPAEAPPRAISGTALEEAREQWTRTARAYSEWVGPLIAHRDAGDLPASAQGVHRALALPLNPFAVVGDGTVRSDLIDNPSNRVFLPENRARLDEIARHVGILRDAVEAYFTDLDPAPPRAALVAAGILSAPADPATPAPALVFDATLLPALTARERAHAAASALGEGFARLEETVLRPLRTLVPDFARLAQAHVGAVLRAGADQPPDSLEALFRDLHTLFAWEGDPPFADVALDRLSADSRWREVLASAPSAASVSAGLDRLRAHRRVDSARARRVPRDVLAALDRVESELREAEALFPGEDLLDPSARERLAAIRREAEALPQGVSILLDLEDAEATAAARLAETAALGKALEDRRDQLSDPSVWARGLESEVAALSADLRPQAEALLASMRDRIARAPALAPAEAFRTFRAEGAALLEALAGLDQFFREPPPAAAPYFASSGAPQHARRVTLQRLKEALQPPVGAPVDAVEGVRAWKREGIAAYLEDRTDLLRVYSTLDTRAHSPASLQRAFSQLAAHPFALHQDTAAPLAALGSPDGFPAADGEGTARDPTAADLFWALSAASAEGHISAAGLTAATAAFLASDAPPSAAESLGRAWGVAYRRLQAGHAGDLPRLLEFAHRLPELVPTPFQDERARFGHDLARLLQETARADDDQLPAADEWRARAAAAPDPALATLLTEAAALREEAGQTGFLEGIALLAEASPFIVSAAPVADGNIIDVRLRGDLGTLRFLALSVDDTAVFLQQSPVTLRQFFLLARHLEIDLEDFLMTAENRFPRTFELGGQIGFSPSPRWILSNRLEFPPLPFVPPERLPMHLGSPLIAKAMADRLGWRLPAPAEAAALVRHATARSTAPSALVLDAAEQDALHRNGAPAASVYRDALRSAEALVGGRVFEAAAPAADSFGGALGGTAELAFADGRFFVLGPSWLHIPADNAPPVALEDPADVFIDLGFRFAFDAPHRSFRDQVTGKILAAFQSLLPPEPQTASRESTNP